MGPVCHFISVIGGSVIYLKSHTLNVLSSPPDANKWFLTVFHDITLTSLVWASFIIFGGFLESCLTSQKRIERSIPHEAKTFSSFGDHWISSTESVWPER